MTASKMRADRFRLDMQGICVVLGEVHELQRRGYDEEASSKYEQIQKDIEALRLGGGESSYLAYYANLPHLNHLADAVEKFQTNPAEAVQEAKDLRNRLSRPLLG